MGDDPQILDYEDEILHRSDLRSLGEGCWLSDAAISFYLAYAHKEIFGSPDAIQALPPSMAFLLIHSAGSDVADIVQPLRLAEVRPSLPRVACVPDCASRAARVHPAAAERQRRRLEGLRRLALVQHLILASAPPAW